MFKVCYLQVAVVDEPLVVLCDATSHAVVEHGDEWRSGGVRSGGVDECPQDRAIFAVVGDGPDTGRSFDKRLVAVVVELRSEISRKERRGRKVGDGGVLIELIRRVNRICAALGGEIAVADVVEPIAGAVVGINSGNSVCQLAASIVTVGDRIVLRESCSSLGNIDASASGIVCVVVLRNDVGWRCVADLKQLIVRVVLPRGS